LCHLSGVAVFARSVTYYVYAPSLPQPAPCQLSPSTALISGFACLRIAWTALQLSLSWSRTDVRSRPHSICALPANPNPAPNPEV
jgi:hypothetical protein